MARGVSFRGAEEMANLQIKLLDRFRTHTHALHPRYPCYPCLARLPPKWAASAKDYRARSRAL